MERGKKDHKPTLTDLSHVFCDRLQIILIERPNVGPPPQYFMPRNHEQMGLSSTPNRTERIFQIASVFFLFRYKNSIDLQ